jgi:hypothetical protein
MYCCMFIVLGTYCCTFAFYCIVYVLLYCVRIILCLRFIVLLYVCVLLYCVVLLYSVALSFLSVLGQDYCHRVQTQLQ